MARSVPSFLLWCGLFAAACHTPAPRPWLRYARAGDTDWKQGDAGLLTATLHGAQVTVDLGQRQTRIEVRVDNGTAAPIEFRMGPEASSPRAAIGEVKLRPRSGPVGVPGPDIVPYNSMQRLVVDADWRGTFYLDTPLGREPGIGQYFVFTVEARDPAGACERRTLPLIATNAGTRPADGS